LLVLLFVSACLAIFDLDEEKQQKEAPMMMMKMKMKIIATMPM